MSILVDKLNPSFRIRRQEIEMIMDELHIGKDTRILEIGCGTGVQSLCMSQKSDCVVTSDVDLENVKFRNLCLVKCSGEYLPFRDGGFDVVYSSNVLEHIRDKGLALGGDAKGDG